MATGEPSLSDSREPDSSYADGKIDCCATACNINARRSRVCVCACIISCTSLHAYTRGKELIIVHTCTRMCANTGQFHTLKYNLHFFRQEPIVIVFVLFFNRVTAISLVFLSLPLFRSVSTSSRRSDANHKRSTLNSLGDKKTKAPLTM